MQSRWTDIESDMVLAHRMTRNFCRKFPPWVDIDIEGIGHEALVIARNTYKEDRGRKFKSWLYLMIIRCTISEFRHLPFVNRRFPGGYELYEEEKFEDWKFPSSNIVEEKIIEKDILYKVCNSLLDKRLKRKFRKRFIEKKSIKQIAKEEETTRKSVWVTMWVIREKVKVFAENN